MGCITIKAGRSNPTLIVLLTQDDKYNVKVSDFLHTIIKISQIINNINVKTYKTSKNINVYINKESSILINLTSLLSFIKIKTSRIGESVSFNADIVCSVLISDDLELWWCDGWKMLWNNKTRALWPEDLQ